MAVTKKSAKKSASKKSKSTSKKSKVETKELGPTPSAEETTSPDAPAEPTEPEAPREFRNQYVLFKHSPDGQHTVASPFVDNLEELAAWFEANAEPNTKYRRARLSVKAPEKVVETKTVTVGF